MNTYTFSEIKMGQKESFNVKLTEDMFKSFLNLTGDTNPLHMDSDYAKKLGFKSKVAYGMLTSSFYSTLVGVYLPGEYALLHGIDIQFNKPAYVGDNLVVAGEVTFINEAYRQIEVKGDIKNQEGVQISKAKIKVGLSE
jgi:3-hydroxybutyryl-CoA dehydratase